MKEFSRKEPRTPEEAIEQGRYFGRNFIGKIPLSGLDVEDAEQEGAMFALDWLTYYCDRVDLWTFIKRRFADLARSHNGRYAEPPGEWPVGTWPL